MYNNKLVASCNEKEIKRDEVGDYLKHSMNYKATLINTFFYFIEQEVLM